MALITTSAPVGITNTADMFYQWAPLTAADKEGVALNCTGFTKVTVSVYGVFDGCTWSLAHSFSDFSVPGSGDQAYVGYPYYDQGIGDVARLGVLVNNVSGTAPAERVFTISHAVRFIKPAIILPATPSASVLLFVSALLQRA